MKLNEKSLYYKYLKPVVFVLPVCIVAGCASGNDNEWPVLQADNLWNEIEEKANDESAVSLNSVNLNDTSLNNSFDNAHQMTMDEIRETISNSEIRINELEQNINVAIAAYNQASNDEKPQYWRGVEIEKSRLNDVGGTLRQIEYQLSSGGFVSSELTHVRTLLERILRMTPKLPE
ncbi:hypothetical protein [Pseudemcibacter aquimaris]|uniref:hypothetical protein n=1 Tax=Pseudemcibacter aquimaris TaxID=2857064 RepID=UPI002010FE5B|nr:hypothetical protein [Pseudemcibacter aquimaris]MCC3861420.1 hypothetical protein [Pseudemcibacter aquimaris]WDU58190.1 hypothetical protein KW060_13430 [Pseudemcibacter aquimaris]